MSEPSKRTNVRDENAETTKIKLEEKRSGGALAGKREVEDYLRRKAEVTETDRQQFQHYLQQKAQIAPAPRREPAAKPKFNRRNLLKVVAGTAVVGEAAAVGHSWITAGSVSEQGAKHAGSRYAEAQRHHITRELIDSKSDVGGRGLGKWIALLPTKLGGGTYALDLNTNRVLASIWYCFIAG